MFRGGSPFKMLQRLIIIVLPAVTCLVKHLRRFWDGLSVNECWLSCFLSLSCSADACSVRATGNGRLLSAGSAPLFQSSTAAVCGPLSTPLHAAAPSNTTGKHLDYLMATKGSLFSLKTLKIIFRCYIYFFKMKFTFVVGLSKVAVL